MLKRTNKRGLHGEVSQLGDWSPVPWRFRVLLIVAVAVVLTVATLLIHVH